MGVDVRVDAAVGAVEQTAETQPPKT